MKKYVNQPSLSLFAWFLRNILQLANIHVEKGKHNLC